MARKTRLNVYRKTGTTFFGILLVLCLGLSIGCSPTTTVTTTLPVITTSPAPTDPLTYINSPLPTWTAGKFNAALLEARGGVSPYHWMLKADSQLPEGFQLYTDGKLTGTPRLLPEVTGVFTTLPFMVEIMDSAGQQVTVTLNIPIVSPDTSASSNNTSDNKT